MKFMSIPRIAVWGLATLFLAVGLHGSGSVPSVEDVRTTDRNGNFVGAQQVNAWLDEGNTIAISFWSKACSPCLESLPYENSLAEKFRYDGLRMLWINDYDKPGDIPEKVWEKCSAMTILFDQDGVTRKAFGSPAWGPVFIFNREHGLIWEGHSFELADPLLERMLEFREPIERKKQSFSKSGDGFRIAIETIDHIDFTRKSVEMDDDGMTHAGENTAPAYMISQLSNALFPYGMEISLRNVPRVMRAINFEVWVADTKARGPALRRAFDTLLRLYGLEDAVTIDESAKIVTIDFSGYHEIF